MERLLLRNNSWYFTEMTSSMIREIVKANVMDLFGAAAQKQVIHHMVSNASRGINVLPSKTS